MRRVLVGGREFTIPNDVTYVVRDIERREFNRSTVTKEFTFHPEPHPHVSVRSSEREDSNMFNAGDGSVPGPEEWVEQPPCDLADFLLMDKNPCAESYPSNYFHKETYQRQVFDNKYKTATGRTSSKKPARKSAVLPRPMYDLERMDDRFRGINPADHAAWAESIDGKGKRRPMANKFTSGTRVLYRHPVSKKRAYATVVGVVDEMSGHERPGTILLCTDEPYLRFNHHENYTGEQRGVMVSAKKAEVDEAMGDTWHNVPDNVGVCARKEFRHDDVGFPAGCTGRIVAPPDADRNMVLVSWNFSNDNFHTHEDSGGGLWNQCWEVPLSKVSMCLMNNNEKKVISHWPAGMGNKRPERKVKDVCIVTGRSVSYMNEETGREQILPEATVVELLKNNGGSHRTWTCRVIGGCPDGMINATMNIRELYLKNHPHPDRFYRPGEVVEIVAKVDFRKVALQGMKGKVILSTDTEGDVGIEFKEDIGAGSLDGIGKEGHCIYIEADLVKSSE
jgi:hypothetical protein